MSRKFAIASVIATLLATATAITAHGLVQGWLRYDSPLASEYEVRGIDVSHHQGAIDWGQVAEDHVDFTYIKATEGGDWTDPRFAENWQSAADVGIPRGAYHFFTFCRDGLTQARHFIATVPLDPAALPPAIDLEFGGNCQDASDNNVVIRELFACAHHLEDHYGQTPIVYVTAEAFDVYLSGLDPLPWPLWYRSLMVTPRLPTGQEWTWWQYSNRGRVRGIDAPVDLNVFAGTSAELSGRTQTP